MKRLTATVPLSITLLLAGGYLTTLVASERTAPDLADRTSAALSASTPAPASAATRTRSAAVTLVVAGDKQSARYHVQEQLVGFNLPSFAIGETNAVTGAIALDSSGRIIRDASTITVNVSGLRSDSDRRDGYVRHRILETDRYPTVTLVPTSITGLPYPLPATGTATFAFVGDLTVRGVTRPTTWQVKATFDSVHVTGVASTSFTFDDFGLTQPHVPVVLSVADTIQLSYDFALVRDARPN